MSAVKVTLHTYQSVGGISIGIDKHTITKDFGIIEDSEKSKVTKQVSQKLDLIINAMSAYDRIGPLYIELTVNEKKIKTKLPSFKSIKAGENRIKANFLILQQLPYLFIDQYKSTISIISPHQEISHPIVLNVAKTFGWKEDKIRLLEYKAIIADKLKNKLSKIRQEEKEAIRKVTKK